MKKKSDAQNTRGTTRQPTHNRAFNTSHTTCWQKWDALCSTMQNSSGHVLCPLLSAESPHPQKNFSRTQHTDDTRGATAHTQGRKEKRDTESDREIDLGQARAALPAPERAADFPAVCLRLELRTQAECTKDFCGIDGVPSVCI